MRQAALLVAALAGASCTRVEESASRDRELPVITTSSGIEMVCLPGGELEMGSEGGNADEAPPHRVRVDPFWVDRQEVTQEHFQRLMAENPSRVKHPRHPVDNVTWVLAALYANARSRAEGLEPCYDEETAACDLTRNGYRLPTEAEWEYACRAGTRSAYSFGDGERALGEHAWYAGNSGKTTHPVGQKRPNPWGLHDVHGNVAEWTNDIYDAEYYRASPTENPRGPEEGRQYVVRGGSWKNGPEVLRSAHRVAENPGFADACLAPDTLGFRCVRRAPAANGDGAARAADGEGDARAEAKRERREQGAARRTGILRGDIYLEHATGEGFPERPARLEAVLRGLREGGILAELTPIDPAPAPIEWIATVHDPEYVERVRAACEGLGDRIGHLGSSDVPIGSRSYDAAVAAVGGVLAAVDAVIEGKVRNAFCAVRPPGHHALRDRAMGFCIFNNVAIAARYVQKRHGLRKVLIIDWDVHHGNGTQEAFYEDPSVLFFSTHLHPFYPMTGSEELTGRGDGEGTNINVALRPGDGDDAIQKAFRERLVPAASMFQPDFVLISCGFDGHAGDLLGRLAITSEGFAELTRIVKGIAERSCDGRLVSILEGGYTLDNLASASAAHVRALME